MKKLIVLTLCLLLALSALTGCGQSAPKADAPAASPVVPAADSDTATDRLVIWSYMNEGEPVGIWQQSVVDKYCEMYPDVDVELVFCGREILSQFQTKLNDKDSKDFPDLVSQMSGTMLP